MTTITIRGNVYISPKALTKLNSIGVKPIEAEYSKESYDTFEYLVDHKPAFHYTPGHVGCRGVFQLASEA